MKKAIYSRIPMAAVIAAFFAVGVVGCSENAEKSAQNSKPCTGKAQCVKAQPKSAQAQKAANKPTVQAAKNNANQLGTKKQTPSVKQTANGETGKPNVTARPQTQEMPTQAAADDEQSIEARRAKQEAQIYAVIRIKMEEMIEMRAELLKQGTNPSDPKIRDLEGSIMKARELLIEAGEVVEEVNPPIVQRVPRQ